MFSPAARAIRRGGRALVELLYPPVCLLCESQELPGGERLCEVCQGELSASQGFTCRRCGAAVGPFTDVAEGCPSCRNQTLRFDAVVRLGRYEGKLREACLTIKHVEAEPLARALAGVLAHQRRAELEAEHLDLIVPVPLYWWRRVRRGFNQAEALAGVLAKRLEVPVRPRLVRRTRNTQPQADLSRAERLANVRGAFRASGRRRLDGARVAIIDDILTTGATCSEVARALKRAGASRVIAVVLAKS